MFFSKLQRTESIVLRTLYYVLYTVPIVKYEMRGLAVKYGLSDVRHGLSTMLYSHVLYRQFIHSFIQFAAIKPNQKQHNDKRQYS